MPITFPQKKNFPQKNKPLAWETKELNEFTYSLNGFINITEIYWQNQHDFFFSISIFSRCRLVVRKALFLYASHTQPTRERKRENVCVCIRERTRRRLENIFYFRFPFSPRLESRCVFVDDCVRITRERERKRSLWATCWLAFNFSSPFALQQIDVHTKCGIGERGDMKSEKLGSREREKCWKSERESLRGWRKINFK